MNRLKLGKECFPQVLFLISNIIMKQYLIIARDGNDANALDRRMQARPDHFTGARKLKADGNFVLGGAMLSEEGKMDGSIMIVQFETDEEFHTWLRQEPYVRADVWQTVEIKPFRVADV